MEKVIREIYIVMCVTGDDTFPVKAFANKLKAEAYAKVMNEHYDELESKYMSLSQEEKEKIERLLFMRYLMETDSSYYERAKNAFDDDDDEKHFDFDEFWSRFDDFLAERELVHEYMNVCEITGKQRECIEVFEEYEKNEYNNVLPFYYMSNQTIEFEE